jgi:hypothetical protein
MQADEAFQHHCGGGAGTSNGGKFAAPQLNGGAAQCPIFYGCREKSPRVFKLSFGADAG